jgi:hypothetical protein
MIYADAMALAFRAEHYPSPPAALVAIAPLGYYPSVPARYRSWEGASGCVVIRVPELPAGLYCERRS